MTRLARSVAALLVTAAFVAPATTATAAPPTQGDAVEELPAGAACEFPISVTYIGKSGFNVLPHNPQYVIIGTSPGGKVTVENLDNGNSVTINATGAFRYTEQPDGSLVIRAGGNNFLYKAPEIGATALATSGPITLRISPEGEFVEADTSHARVRDLCAELS